MSELNAKISGYVVGDNLEVRRTVTELPSAIETAWLTMKQHRRAADADKVVQKIITTADAPGTGHIEAAGGVGIDGELRFDLTQDDTTALGMMEWVYDLQIKLVDTTVYTLEIGTICLTLDVTRSTTP